MQKFIVAIFIFIVALVVNYSHAQQVVHIENSRLSAENEGFSGNLNLSAAFLQNVNDIFRSNNRAHLQYTKKKATWLSLSQYNLTVFNGNAIVNDGFQHFRYSYQKTETFQYETFAQYQFNTIIKIDHRYLVGGGTRFRLYNAGDEKSKLFLGTSIMGEYEEETDFGIINRALRGSFYLSLGIPIKKRVVIDFMGYYQPDLLNWKDYRISAEASVDIYITEKLQFRFINSLLFDTRPPDGIRTTFYNFTNGLNFKF